MRHRIIIEGKSMHDMTKAEQEEIWKLSKTNDVFEKDINGDLWQVLDLSNPTEESDNLLVKKT